MPNQDKDHIEAKISDVEVLKSMKRKSEDGEEESLSLGKRSPIIDAAGKSQNAKKHVSYADSNNTLHEWSEDQSEKGERVSQDFINASQKQRLLSVASQALSTPEIQAIAKNKGHPLYIQIHQELAKFNKEQQDLLGISDDQLMMHEVDDITSSLHEMKKKAALSERYLSNIREDRAMEANEEYKISQFHQDLALRNKRTSSKTR